MPGADVRRTGQDQAHQAKTKPGDISAPGYAVESKIRKRMSATIIREGLEQAVEAAAEGELPVCCHREDRRGWFVTLRIEDWLAIVAERHQGEERVCDSEKSDTQD